MTTTQRFRNKFVLQIRERDHNPPHLHLFGCGFDVAIDLRTLKSTGEWPDRLKSEVVAWITEHQAELLEEWYKWHK